MNAQRKMSLALLVLTLAAPRAHAQCWLPGPLDAGVSPNGTDGVVDAVFVWNDQVVIGGHFSSIEGTPANNIALRSSFTGEWFDLGGGITDASFARVYDLTVYDGELIASGVFDAAGGVPVENIARWDGTSWRALGAGIDNANVFAVFPYVNDLIAGGDFTTAGGISAHGIARWDGTAWHALTTGVANGTVQTLGYYSGDLIVGGDFEIAGGLTASSIARWNGSSWSSMAGGMSGYVYALSLWNGDLVAGGTFDVAGGIAAKNIARWNGATWSKMGNGIAPPFQQSGGVECMANVAGDLWVGGFFVTAGDISAINIARWNGAWAAVGGGSDATVRALARFDTEVVAGGDFHSMGGVAANTLARYDSYQWGAFGGGAVDYVLASTVYRGRMVAAGQFRQPTNGQVAFNIVSWDGVSLFSFDAGMNGPVDALESISHGLFGAQELIAGGQFTRAGANAANHIARWIYDPIGSPTPEWTPMGAGFNGEVAAIERFNNATYAAGGFTLSQSTPLSHIARFNETPNLWEPLSGGVNGFVNCLREYDGSLYAGGSFTTANGVSTGGLARWNGTIWSAVAGIFQGTVLAIEVFDGQLVVAGNFAGMSGSPNIARYDGVSWTTLGTGGINGIVTSLRTFSNTLYVGGQFTVAGGASAIGIAAFDGDWHDVSGGVQAPPFLPAVISMAAFHGELQVTGIFSTAGIGGEVNTTGWARYSPTCAPWIASHPSSQNAQAGGDVFLNVLPADGYDDVSYQWRKDDVDLDDGATGNGSVILGAHEKTMQIHWVSPGDAGAYKVVVSNANGGQTSSVANLTVEGVLDVASGNGLGVTALTSLGPNPTSGPTTISFTLADAARSTLRVFDVSGRLVRSIDEGMLPAGSHRTAWDARDSDKRVAAGGVYFVTLEVGGHQVASQRLVLLR